MPTCAASGNWTDRGARAVRASPRRLDAAERQLEAMGGHDMVLVYAAPDDAVAARFKPVLNGFGSVRTRTTKALPEAACRGIMASLG